MGHSLRTLDDGAWVSVNDRRQTGTSELWRVQGVCDCPVGDLLVEGVVDVGVDGSTVTARVAGRCLDCSEQTVTDHLPVGRMVDGRYRPLADGVVREPVGRSAREAAIRSGIGE